MVAQKSEQGQTMSFFSLSPESSVEVEESSYDDTLSGVAYGYLQSTFAANPFASQKVKLFDLAEALGTALRACLFNAGTHKEYLWETGHSLTMKRASATKVELALPTGTSAMLIHAAEIEALILELYRRGFSALIEYAANGSTGDH
jgi:hypothetical protein